MRNPLDADMQRRAIAREEWIKWRMTDVPAIYLALMPVTESAEQLRNAEENIRAMILSDQRLLAENPWRHCGPEPRAVDFTMLPEHEVTDMCIKSQPEEGFPAVVRDGFEDHPEVQRVLRNLRDPDSPKTTFLNIQHDLDKVQAQLSGMVEDVETFDRPRFETLTKKRDELRTKLEVARASWPEGPAKPPEPWKIGDVERLERESGK